MNSAGAKRITSKSPTYEREITSHITPGLLLGTLNMEMTDLIGPGGVIANLRVTSKKQALQELAKRAAELTGKPERAIFEVLIERERLGTTGVGNGIAIPHGKLPDRRVARRLPRHGVRTRSRGHGDRALPIRKTPVNEDLKRIAP